MTRMKNWQLMAVLLTVALAAAALTAIAWPPSSTGAQVTGAQVTRAQVTGGQLPQAAPTPTVPASDAAELLGAWDFERALTLHVCRDAFNAVNTAVHSARAQESSHMERPRARRLRVELNEIAWARLPDCRAHETIQTEDR